MSGAVGFHRDVRDVALLEVCEVTAGPSGALLKNLADRREGAPVVTPTDLTDEQTISPARLRRVPEDDGVRLEKFALRAGDVVMVRQGALGRLAVAAEEHAGWLFGSSCLRIRPNTQLVLPGYLAAYLVHPFAREVLLDPALPGTVPSFNAADVKKLTVAVPTIERQALIVETLRDMDAVITGQRAMARRLESIKPSVFAELLQGER